VSVYRWVDHTAELELEIEAESEEAVFHEAFRALRDLLGERVGDRGEPAAHRVNVSDRDRATLLAEWLSELVFLAETEDFVPEAVERLRLSDNAVEATVAGRRASPPHLVKAVTYHRLGMWDENGAWRARIVFDV
jgi:protein archease